MLAFMIKRPENKKRKGKFTEKVKGVGIRNQLVFGFTVFVLMILVIVWVFQVLLLDYFYERIKLNDLDNVILGIEESLENPELDAICAELASRYDVCITIFEADNGMLRDAVVDKEVSPTCVIHYASRSVLESDYKEALASDNGRYTKKYPLMQGASDDFPDRYQEYPDKNGDGAPTAEFERPFVKDNEMSIVAVSIKALTDSYGNEYAAFINLKFTPVNAIQQTRSVQFIYIAAVIILAAMVFSYIFSSKVARPLEKMTRSAELMANGDFRTEFKEEGYRETRRLAKTLNYAVNEISKTDKLQRELIANVSHDLRTPLTLISGYSEMMRDIPGENTPENSQLIIDETRRLTTLVNDMLDFSKYSSGFEVPDIKVFNLTESVRITMSRYSELVRANGYSIIFDAETDVTVAADERMILQVIYNLLNNAVNYTGSDKTVSIRQTVSENGAVRISISDTGNGISEEDLSMIWDRYYKINQTHVRAVTGSGLGLSIVSRLLQLHSASYGVESTNGVGSTFWFELKVNS